MDDSSNRSPIDAAIEVYLANEIINNYMQHILDNGLSAEDFEENAAAVSAPKQMKGERKNGTNE